MAELANNNHSQLLLIRTGNKAFCDNLIQWSISLGLPKSLLFSGGYFCILRDKDCSLELLVLSVPYRQLLLLPKSLHF